MAGLPGTPRTLEEAVRAELAAGVLDPVEILARISERYGQAKLLTWIVAVVARIAAGGSSVSHSASASGGRSSSRAPGVVSGKTERGLPRVRKAAGDIADDFFGSARWVSADVGWKPVADLTADDCLAVAAQYEFLVDRADEHRRWFVDAAAAIDAERVSTVGDLERKLAPPSELTAAQAKMLAARAGHG